MWVLVRLGRTSRSVFRNLDSLSRLAGLGRWLEGPRAEPRRQNEEDGFWKEGPGSSWQSKEELKVTDLNCALSRIT